jgi:hypothetical protein
MKKLSLFLVVMILLLAAAVAGYKYGIQREAIRIERDTVYTERISSVTDTVKKWFPKTDTVYYPVSDTLTFPAIIERLDTVLIRAQDSLWLNVTRYPYPKVNYSLAYKFVKRDSVKTITERIYLQKPESFLGRFNFGIGIGYGIYKDGAVPKASPSINLSVYYSLF